MLGIYPIVSADCFSLPLKFAIFVFDSYLYFEENVEHHFGKRCEYAHFSNGKFRFAPFLYKNDMKLNYFGFGIPYSFEKRKSVERSNYIELRPVRGTS